MSINHDVFRSWLDAVFAGQNVQHLLDGDDVLVRAVLELSRGGTVQLTDVNGQVVGTAVQIHDDIRLDYTGGKPSTD